MVSEYSRFPFKVKLDYFMLYLILVSTCVIFLLLFSMNKRRRTKEASPLRLQKDFQNILSKPKTVLSFRCVHFQAQREMKVQTLNMLSVLRNRPVIISVSALKVHFIYLCFSLNDCLLVFSLVISRLVSL